MTVDFAKGLGVTFMAGMGLLLGFRIQTWMQERTEVSAARASALAHCVCPCALRISPHLARASPISQRDIEQRIELEYQRRLAARAAGQLPTSGR